MYAVWGFRSVTLCILKLLAIVYEIGSGFWGVDYHVYMMDTPHWACVLNYLLSMLSVYALRVHQ